MGDFFAAFMWWMFVGSVVWTLLYARGLAAETHLQRLIKGKPISLASIVVANLVVMLIWPVPVARYFMSRRVWR